MKEDNEKRMKNERKREFKRQKQKEKERKTKFFFPNCFTLVVFRSPLRSAVVDLLEIYFVALCEIASKLK